MKGIVEKLKPRKAPARIGKSLSNNLPIIMAIIETIIRP